MLGALYFDESGGDESYGSRASGATCWPHEVWS